MKDFCVLLLSTLFIKSFINYLPQSSVLSTPPPLLSERERKHTRAPTRRDTNNNSSLWPQSSLSILAGFVLLPQIIALSVCTEQQMSLCCSRVLQPPGGSGSEPEQQESGSVLLLILRDPTRRRGGRVKWWIARFPAKEQSVKYLVWVVVLRYSRLHVVCVNVIDSFDLIRLHVFPHHRVPVHQEPGEHTSER